MRITVAAPAKINLWLRVGERGTSGFHGLDTLFCSLHLADSVVVRPGDTPTPELEISYARPLTAMPDLGPPEKNLAYRAAVSFMERAGLTGGPAIRLVKRIPVGAGLGGGSSDAAAVLRAMARLNPGTLDTGQLAELGMELGSDVPFFVQGAALAHATGRGERIAPLKPLPARPVVLAMPDVPVATGEAFRWLDEDRDDGAPDVPDQPGHDRVEVRWDQVAEEAINDFEPSVFRRHPGLADVKTHLLEHGARPALLAGSGSTVFGVFEEADVANEAARSLETLDPTLRLFVTRTRTR